MNRDTDRGLEIPKAVGELPFYQETLSDSTRHSTTK